MSLSAAPTPSHFMDFFEHQDRARRSTRWLVFYFGMAVVLLIAAIYFISLMLFAGAQARHSHGNLDFSSVHFALWNPKVFVFATAGVLAVVFFGSAYKTSELSAGGSAVATLMGGRPVLQGTADANERKLLNVVEEMSIASGVPMPQVYVMEEERGINAFAAGHTASDAAIGVTRGCIEKLSRDELQGVIGHEFSHILNGDMRLNIRLIGIIFGLLCLATIGRILLSSRSGDSRERNNALPLLGLALIILGAIGVFFGRLIQAAVSRQREFLADASSVQFTRNPAGLSGALQKIGSSSAGSRLESEHAPDLCHMFFGNGLGDSLFESFATHPPLSQRIRVIDPAWDGRFMPLKPTEADESDEVSDDEVAHRPAPGRFPLSGMVVAGLADDQNESRPPVIRPQSVVSSIGTISGGHLHYAEQLREALPENLRQAAREPLSAAALIYALLLDDDAALRAEQLTEIGRQFEASVSIQAAALYPEVAAVARHARLPLVNLAIGALRNLTVEQFRRFSATLEWLVNSDGQVELFEFVLQKIVCRHLAPQFSPARPTVVQFYTLKPLVPDCAVILSAFAHVGSGDLDEIQKAFAAGAPFLHAPVEPQLELMSRENCGVEALDAALNRLALAVPIIKKNLLEACAQVVGADGVILEAEAELLRAVADTLDCPIPPLVD